MPIPPLVLAYQKVVLATGLLGTLTRLIDETDAPMNAPKFKMMSHFGQQRRWSSVVSNNIVQERQESKKREQIFTNKTNKITK